MAPYNGLSIAGYDIIANAWVIRHHGNSELISQVDLQRRFGISSPLEAMKKEHGKPAPM